VTASSIASVIADHFGWLGFDQRAAGLGSLLNGDRDSARLALLSDCTPAPSANARQQPPEALNFPARRPLLRILELGGLTRDDVTGSNWGFGKIVLSRG
jgi:hypothetical protein